MGPFKVNANKLNTVTVKKKHSVLKIPTRQRQTSWLYTAHGEGVELRTTKKHSKVEGLNAGSSENESNATTTQPHGLQ